MFVINAESLWRSTCRAWTYAESIKAIVSAESRKSKVVWLDWIYVGVITLVINAESLCKSTCLACT